MKKYLMTGIAAVALGGMFSGCNNFDDLNGSNTAEEQIIQNYENAFVTRFGQPAEDLTWGFGDDVASTRSGNIGTGYEAYPATHTYTDANGNVIAGANMNHNEWADPNKEYGGWIVPDALTEGQKLRVQKYFQANPNLSYEDPHYANFFIQQVYTGGTSAPETGNKESTVGADGQGHKGMTLNQLTVGQACSHINDFNAGTCTTSSVLDNGKTVNNATYHNDQITLMVNVDDTSCFGYHETSGSNTSTNNNHNDKMALVSAATIDAWAAANGNPGEAVVDKWNRSFMGFDYELLPESDIILDSYALLSQVPNINNMQYAWDGTKVMTLGAAPEATGAEEVDITSTFAQNTRLNNVTCSYDSNGYVVCNFTGQYYNSIQFYQNADWTSYDKLVIEFAEASPINATINSNNGDVQIKVGDTKVEVPTPNYVYNNNGGPTISNGGIGTSDPLTLTIKKVTLVKEATVPDASITYYNPTYLLGDDNKISFYSRNTNMYGGIIREVQESEMKTSEGYLDLTFFQGLVSQGYHPITTDLKTWVKWQAACDGYYSDWIVTLTKAERQTTPPPTPGNIVCRIIVEDLTVGENSDFDFNDVVFDVCKNGDLIIRAIGGELPIYIGSENANEVHAACSVTLSGDTNKGQNSHLFMRNTGWKSDGSGKVHEDINYDAELGKIQLGGTYNTPADAKNIGIWVHKNGTNVKLKAPKGKVASMICVGTDYKWCAERQDIDDKYHKNGVKLFHQYVIGDPNYGDDWANGNAWYQKLNK